jgi:hypothetical protein
MSVAVIARFPLRESRGPRPWRVLALAITTLVACIAAAVFTSRDRPWIALAIIVGIVVANVWRWRADRPKVGGWICFYPWGVTREDDDGSVRLLGFGEPFGVSLLADHARSHALLAFTTPTHTRYATVSTLLGPPAILARATTIAESDAATLVAPFALSGADALSLLRMIEQAAPRATERLFLNGSRGERIAVDNTELRIEPMRDTGAVGRGRTFDLRAPLEWRGFMFHESVGPVTTLYQATWVRQGAGEIVFVAPMPHVLASQADRRVGLTGDDVAQVVRDLELLQSLPDSPPPRELRTAIERAFMLPLRQALDRAPRAARSAPPTRLQSSPDHV